MSKVTVTATAQTAEKPLNETSAYIWTAAANLHSTDYHITHGIDSPEVVGRFSIGYDPTFNGMGRALIIPTGHNKQNFVAVLLDQNEAITAGTNRRRDLFNPDAVSQAEKPIYIVEREIDALAIITAGGEAVAIGTDNGADLLLKETGKYTPKQPLILAVTSKKARTELAEGFREQGVYFLSKMGDGGEPVANFLFDRNEDGAYLSLTEKLKPNPDLANPNVGKETLITQLRVFTSVAVDGKAAAEVNRSAEYRKKSAGGFLQDFVDGISSAAETVGIPTGYKTLDETLDGGLYEGLYILGAISSLGKTTLALQMADQIAKAGKDVLIFSLEMARTELMAKSISRHTLQICIERGLNSSNAKTARGITIASRRKNYSETEKRVIDDAIVSYGEYAEHIFIEEGMGDVGAKEIRARTEEHRNATGEAPVVIVDYLQIVTPYNERYSDKQNTDKAVLELKRLSRDLKTPVIVVSSFNRSNYDTPAAMEAFKESGAIEYGADVLIGLQLKGVGKNNFNVNEAKSKNPRDVEMVILKNRSGETGKTIEYRFYPMFNYFEEV